MVRVQHISTMDVLIESLAFVRGLDADFVREQVEAGGGDLEIDSKVGQAVAVLAEVKLDMEGAIKPEDQSCTNLTSLRSLELLVLRRMPSGEGAN